MRKSLAIVNGVGLAVLTTFASHGSLVLGQCPCQNGIVEESIVYEEYASSAQPYSPEQELEQIDLAEETIHFTVIVDEQAIVSVNGEPTISKGKVRPYIVRGLQAGKSYDFQFLAVVRKPQGDVYAAKEKVTIRAGEAKQVVLKVRRANRADYPPPAPEPAPLLLAPPVS